MKIKFILAMITISLSAGINAQELNFYSFKAETIDGEEISLDEFKGKKVLVVNVASKCGFTKQYDEKIINWIKQ